MKKLQLLVASVIKSGKELLRKKAITCRLTLAMASQTLKTHSYAICCKLCLLE